MKKLISYFKDNPVSIGAGVFGIGLAIVSFLSQGGVGVFAGCFFSVVTIALFVRSWIQSRKTE